MGDLFISLIHTCELNGANHFDYLNQWNYRETLARTGALLDNAA